jgi:hypothetical protein
MLGAMLGFLALSALTKKAGTPPARVNRPKGHRPKTSTATKGVGRVPVHPAQTGTWGLSSFPEAISIPDGSTFRRAHFEWPLYSGVQAQYREAVPTFSRHLLVYVDGSYEITHADEYNPDAGYPVEHLAVDAPEALAAGLAVLGFGVGILGGAWLLE